MRLVSYAAAVLVVLGAVGCSGSAGSTSTAGKKGIEGATFTIEVRGETAVLDPATNTTVILPGGGLVASSVGGIDCGYVGGAIHKVCVSAPIAYGTKAVVITATPDSVHGYGYFAWAGACSGSSPCKVDVTSGRLIVVRFATSVAGLGAHPNFSDPSIHGPNYVNSSLPCTACHGASLEGSGIAPSCSQCHAFPFTHTAGSDCGSCHQGDYTDWASVATSADRHAFDPAKVLLNVDHDTNELLVDECLQCHAMFQRPLGITYFVNPAGFDPITGNPAYCAVNMLPDPTVPQNYPNCQTQADVMTSGWALTANVGAWQATKCEVCHNPASATAGKIMKYGAMLDQAFTADYIDLDASATAASYPAQAWLAAPYQWVLGSGGYAQTPYAVTGVKSTATKLCYSCHDPDDEGDPTVLVTIAGVAYGPQGGDSRAFVTAHHAGLTCVDCHPTHDFTPVDPDTYSACGTGGCHDVTKVGSNPGVVHTNHIQ
jgi:hypothetical protein